MRSVTEGCTHGIGWSDGVKMACAVFFYLGFVVTVVAFCVTGRFLCLLT